MELCYDGALVMPSNYVVVDNNEMTYIDGGDAKNFSKNLQGLWNQSSTMRHALKAGGFSWAYIGSLAKVTYGFATAKVAGMLGITVSLVSRALAVIAALGAVAAVTYVWNKRIWY